MPRVKRADFPRRKFALDTPGRSAKRLRQQPTVMRTHPLSSLEVLESRIAPAVVIAPGGRVAHFTDVDGDRVTVSISKGRLNASDFVTSSAGTEVPGGESLLVLDLSDDSGEFNGASVSIVATHSRLGGDGLVNVGFINAGDGLTDLGRVSVDGDLSRIVAGDADTGPRSPGVKMLVAQHFGGSELDVIGGIAKLRITEQPAASAGPKIVPVGTVGGSSAVSTVTATLGSTLLIGATVLPSMNSSLFSAGLVKTGSGSGLLTTNAFTASTAFTGGTLHLAGDSFNAATSSAGSLTVGSIGTTTPNLTNRISISGTTVQPLTVGGATLSITPNTVSLSAGTVDLGAATVLTAAASRNVIQTGASVLALRGGTLASLSGSGLIRFIGTTSPDSSTTAADRSAAVGESVS